MYLYSFVFCLFFTCARVFVSETHCNNNNNNNTVRMKCKRYETKGTTDRGTVHFAFELIFFFVLSLDDSIKIALHKHKHKHKHLQTQTCPLQATSFGIHKIVDAMNDSFAPIHIGYLART